MEKRNGMSKALATILVVAAVLSISVGNAPAQQPEIRIGAEIGPRYIWGWANWFIKPG